MVSEGWYGVPYRDVVALFEEELEALDGLLSTRRQADVEGAHLTARLTLSVPVAPPGLVVAALGPKMLRLAGRLSDGTVTWMTGPKTLASQVVPADHGGGGRGRAPGAAGHRRAADLRDGRPGRGA